MLRRFLIFVVQSYKKNNRMTALANKKTTDVKTAHREKMTDEGLPSPPRLVLSPLRGALFPSRGVSLSPSLLRRIAAAPRDTRVG